jgi:hypothetical protein
VTTGARAKNTKLEASSDSRGRGRLAQLVVALVDPPGRSRSFVLEIPQDQPPGPIILTSRAKVQRPRSSGAPGFALIFWIKRGVMEVGDAVKVETVTVMEAPRADVLSSASEISPTKTAVDDEVRVTGGARKSNRPKFYNVVSKLGDSPRRCTYEHCERPDDSSHFHRIEQDSIAGGQDWTSLVGNILCHSCYRRYKARGTLARLKCLDESERHCTYKLCDRPDESTRFYRIEPGRTSGGQNWDTIVGEVLCQSCYSRFHSRGTLARTRTRWPPGCKRRCTYELCDRPDESRDFYRIEAGKTSGGQDWTSVVGHVLCDACHNRYRYSGTLERTQNKRLEPSERRCMYEHCEKPDESSNFHRIEVGKTAGGQDWNDLAGRVLCHSCYQRFRERGTLCREGGRSIKRKSGSGPATNGSRPSKAGKGSSKSRSKSKSEFGGISIEASDVSWAESRKGKNSSDCQLCRLVRRTPKRSTVCVVPCGHLVLCGSCGDASLFNEEEASSSRSSSSSSSSSKGSKEQGEWSTSDLKKLPLSECPICCETLCAPWVMPKDEWASLGDTAKLLYTMRGL